MTQEKFYEELLGLSGLKIISIEKSPVKLIIHCEHKSEIANCPSCLEPTSIVNQFDTRKVQDLKISEREVWLHIRIQQFVCPTCNRFFLIIPNG